METLSPVPITENSPTWSILSPSQRAVAELVARGLTNREVAEELYMSRHTVGSHLRVVFQKFNVDSRVKLARLVSLAEAGVLVDQ